MSRENNESLRERCMDGMVFNPSTCRLVKQCPEGKERNPITFGCVNKPKSDEVLLYEQKVKLEKKALSDAKLLKEKEEKKKLSELKAIEKKKEREAKKEQEEVHKKINTELKKKNVLTIN